MAVGKRHFCQHSVPTGRVAATRELLSTVQIDLAAFDRSRVQRLDVCDEQYTFDFLDFMDKLLPEADKSALAAQLGKALLYKAHTDKFLEEYEIQTFCGLSCYIPHPQRSDLNRFYKTLGWYANSGMQYFLQLKGITHTFSTLLLY
jgi:hypothetical protein